MSNFTIKGNITGNNHSFENCPNCDKLQKQNEELKAETKKLSSEFWKDTAKLIELYREEGDNRAAEGVVECRVLFNRLKKMLNAIR